jgi:hypothetical protein
MKKYLFLAGLVSIGLVLSGCEADDQSFKITGDDIGKVIKTLTCDRNGTELNCKINEETK